MTADPVLWSRFALYADLLPLFGLACFIRYGLTAPERAGESGRTMRRWLTVLALAGVPISLWGLAASVAGMAGTSLDAIDPGLLREIATGTAVGWAFHFRTAALLLCCAAAFLPTVAVAGAAGVAVAALAWSGHGAMDDGAAGWAHLAADIAHLLAAGVWVGALLAFLILVSRRRDRARAVRALTSFAQVGTVTVAVLAVTGAISGWFLMLRTGAGLLPLDPYRDLLLAKLAAFSGMLLLATLNRFRFTPRLARDASPRAILLSLAIEASLALAILLLVAQLGMLSPQQ